jgi:hypothetical protein
MSEFPESGDNFVVLKPWRILQGSAWHDWQRDALRAQIAASEAAGEPFAARRLRGALDRLKAAGPARITPGEDVDAAGLMPRA